MSVKFRNYLLILTSSVLLFACSKGVPLTEAEIVTPDSSSSESVASSTSGNQASGTAVEDANNFNNIVYFDFDSFDVNPEYQRALNNYSSRNSGSQIKIEGHTDERGGREYNLALGQKRAEAVKQSLTLLGFNESQIEAVSFGKEKPVASGTTEEDYAQNRRAEIKNK